MLLSLRRLELQLFISGILSQQDLGLQAATLVQQWSIFLVGLFSLVETTVKQLDINYKSVLGVITGPVNKHSYGQFTMKADDFWTVHSFLYVYWRVFTLIFRRPSLFPWLSHGQIPHGRPSGMPKCTTTSACSSLGGFVFPSQILGMNPRSHGWNTRLLKTRLGC